MASIQRAHIVMAVKDLRVSQRWYEKVLDCTADEVDPGNWVFMHRDTTVFMLGCCPDETPAWDIANHQYIAYLVVDDVDTFHTRAERAIGEAGGAILKPPRDEPWGMREMAIQTVDGHRMMIATNIGTPSPAWPGPNQ